MLGVGATLVGWSLWSNRRRAAAWSAKFRAAVRAAFGEFKRTMWPPPPPTDESSEEPGDADDGWRILDHTLRRSGIVAGEAYPALIGMAEAGKVSGQRRLLMYQFAGHDGGYMELRTETPSEPVIRRRAIVKVDGEVLSDTTFSPYTAPVVHDVRKKECIERGTRHLLGKGGRIAVSVTDVTTGQDGGSMRWSETCSWSLFAASRPPTSGYAGRRRALCISTSPSFRRLRNPPGSINPPAPPSC